MNHLDRSARRWRCDRFMTCLKTLSTRQAISVLVASIVGSAHAGWVTDPIGGCGVQIPYAESHEEASWSGSCADGMAEGQGTLTSSNGTFVQGEFRRGRPLQATGRELLILNSGWRSIVGVNYANGIGAMSPLAHTVADRNARPVNSFPMVGKWAWEPKNVVCPETHEYRANGLRVLINGQERVESAYAVFRIQGEPKLFKVLHTSIRRSGKSECVADSSPIGSSFYMYVRFDAENSFRTCAKADVDSCFGHATRIPE